MTFTSKKINDPIEILRICPWTVNKVKESHCKSHNDDSRGKYIHDFIWSALWIQIRSRNKLQSWVWCKTQAPLAVLKPRELLFEQFFFAMGTAYRLALNVLGAEHPMREDTHLVKWQRTFNDFRSFCHVLFTLVTVPKWYSDPSQSSLVSINTTGDCIPNRRFKVGHNLQFQFWSKIIKKSFCSVFIVFHSKIKQKQSTFPNLFMNLLNFN